MFNLTNLVGFFFWWMLIRMVLIALVLMGAKYPRLENITANQDIVKLLLTIAVFVWVAMERSGLQ